MEITEAIEKVHSDKELDEKIKEKYLCSALSFLDDWTTKSWELNYYDKSTHKILQITVDDAPHVKTEGAPFKDTEIKEIDISKIKISGSDALTIGKEHYDDKYKSIEVQKIFFALHGGEKEYWSISVITKHLTIVIINIDVLTGDIIISKVHTIFDKNKNAS